MQTSPTMTRVVAKGNKHHPNQSGMTLIEIMVVVAIIAAIMVLGGTILFPGDEAQLRDQATRLTGAIQYVYNEAAIKNKYYRFVFNLDEKSYHVESSTEPFTVSREAPPEGKAPPEEGEEGDENAAGQGNPTAFVAEDSYLIKPVKFPDSLKIKDITVLHLPERQEQGIVYAYFLPNGWAEPMVINLCNEDEEYFYSLEVNPLTGKSLIREEYYEANPARFQEENPIDLEAS